jgi:high-affinity nickel-transport protein
VDLNQIGFGVGGLFVLTWLVTPGIWWFGRIEQWWAVAD